MGTYDNLTLVDAGSGYNMGVSEALSEINVLDGGTLLLIIGVLALTAYAVSGKSKSRFKQIAISMLFFTLAIGWDRGPVLILAAGILSLAVLGGIVLYGMNLRDDWKGGGS